MSIEKFHPYNEIKILLNECFELALKSMPIIIRRKVESDGKVLATLIFLSTELALLSKADYGGLGGSDFTMRSRNNPTVFSPHPEASVHQVSTPH